MDFASPSVLEVNVNNYKHNINQIRQFVGSNVEVMPVIKANAYGTYLNTRLDVLNDFNIVAVATCDEGEFIRKLGFKNEIFILNQVYVGDIQKIVDNDLSVGVCSMQFVNCLANTEKCCKVHIEIETGMGRTGIAPNDINSFVDQILKFKNIKVQGIYTHLSSAGTDFDFTNKQLEIFDNVVKYVLDKCEEVKYIHTAASMGILNFKASHYNLVRPGIITYGYCYPEKVLNKLDLKPVCKLKSKIMFLKMLPKGAGISYGHTFVANSDIKVATVPLGYADGLRRILSNRGKVVINSCIAPIIGNVCMDTCLVDVTNIPNVKLFDDVWFWDNEIITLDEVADLCNTISIEILSTISDRVRRVFLNK